MIYDIRRALPRVHRRVCTRVYEDDDDDDDVIEKEREKKEEQPLPAYLRELRFSGGCGSRFLLYRRSRQMNQFSAFRGANAIATVAVVFDVGESTTRKLKGS